MIVILVKGKTNLSNVLDVSNFVFVKVNQEFYKFFNW
jgi:hypothetical protein